jgi:ribosomal protein S5
LAGQRIAKVIEVHDIAHHQQVAPLASHIARFQREAFRQFSHEVNGRYCGSMVRLIPAAPGTGVIAGASVRAVRERAGIKNNLTKAYGSTNPVNVVKATFHALIQLRTREQVAQLRGIEIA